MEFKLFKSAELIALRQTQSWSLFKYEDCDENSNPKLVSLDFAQNVNFLDVNEQYNLVVTSEGVYSISGEKICDCFNKAEVVSAGASCLIVLGNRSKSCYGLQLIVWNGKKKVLSLSCTDYRYASGHLAVCFNDIWSLYDIDGTLIDDGAFQAIDVEICRDLLIARRIGDNALYSFSKKCFIKEHQVRIVCSHSCCLALCAKIGSSSLEVYVNGKWHVIPGADDFDVLDGMDHLFYIKRDGKYFLYEDDMTRFMQHLYPDGMDFVACDEDRVLLVVNNGEPQFFSKGD